MDKKANFDDKTLKTAAFLAFFPLTGIFGVHNLILKQYWECILRIIIVALIAVSVFDWINPFIDIPPSFPQIFSIIFVASPYIALALYAWAFAEGILISKNNAIKKEPSIATPVTTATGNEQTPQASNAVSSDTMYYTSNLTDAIKQEQKQDPQKKNGKSTIVAFTFSIVLIMYWGSVFLVKPSSVGCTGGSVGLILSMILCLPIDAIMTLVAIVFGVKGLKTKLRNLAIASLIITIIANILIPFAFMWANSLCHH